LGESAMPKETQQMSPLRVALLANARHFAPVTVNGVKLLIYNEKI
jgi:hypothetical protein